MSSSGSLPQIPDASCGTGGAPVPVFTCIVILSPDVATGRLSARVANLPEMTVEGNAERELLMLLTKRFKAFVQDSLQHNRPIPWMDPPTALQPGEQQRFIPVHL